MNDLAKSGTPQEHGQQDGETLLALYLNDHLAGATAGVALCRHLAEAERSAPHALGETLDHLAQEIDQDRSALLDVMSELAVPVKHYKIGAGWIGEKLARLMPHGSALGRTRLNTLVELESLQLGVEGKACLWRGLAMIPDLAEDLTRQLHSLLERADSQAATLENLRARAAEAAFAQDAR
ncbi:MULTISPECIES: hypothetical protein [unclassified Streptomyces]|uniref:hypothetical protein n=1 Tax=unclassified Streptomyces TaxID=2593676 RepID=UPI0033DE6643